MSPLESEAAAIAARAASRAALAPEPVLAAHPPPVRRGERPAPTASESLTRFAIGGLAGCTAKTLIAPLDRTKILFQVSARRFSFRAVAAELARCYREEGVRGLFRGNAMQILRVYPYSGVQLAAFDVYAGALLARRGGAGVGGAAGASPSSGHHSGASAASHLSPLERLFAGAGAGATSVAATYPLDLMRARLAVAPSAPDAGAGGLWRAFRDMSVRGGGLPSLYRGMLPTLLGILPYAGISFAMYETLKQAARERDVAHGGSGEPSTIARLVFGGAAGFAGQAATYPLDIVRRRMQTEGYTPLHAHATYQQQPVPGAPASSVAGADVGALRSLIARLPRTRGGMLEVLLRAYDAEGGRGLFKGLTLNAVKGPAAVGISLTTYDLLKRLVHLG